MQEKRKLYVGIDVHSREHRAALLHIDILEKEGLHWMGVKPLSIRNNIDDFKRLDLAIRSHISCAEDVTIAVDHTGGHYSEPLIHFLQVKGYSVYCLETRAVKAARERFLDQESKSDTIDATSSAYLLYLRDVHGLSFRISAIKPELGSEAAAINSLVLQRWQFNKLAVQTTNRLHQFLIAVFPEGEERYFNKLLKVTPYYPTPKDIIESNCLDKIEGLRQKDKDQIMQLAANTVGVPGEIYQWIIRDLSNQRMEALAKRDSLTSILRTQVATHPYGNILLSFPYLGEIAAGTIIGIIKDIDRWPDKKKFKKVLGVYSSLTQSGASPGRTRQGREGSKRGRRVLFQVCLGCITPNAPDNDFKDYYLRQVAGGKPKMKALVSTMGKLAEIIYHCLEAGELYQYQKEYRTTITSIGNRAEHEPEF